MRTAQSFGISVIVAAFVVVGCSASDDGVSSGAGEVGGGSTTGTPGSGGSQQPGGAGSTTGASGSGTAGAPAGSGGAGMAGFSISTGGTGGQRDAGGTGGSSNEAADGGGRVTCTIGDAGTALAPGAPVLTAGVWKNIGPTAVPFGSAASATFTQGMAISPCNPSVLYLCTDGFDPAQANAGLYRSVNAGSTWTRVGKINTQVDHIDEPIRVRIDPGDHMHMYVGDGVRGGSQGFWVSTDGGDTFTQPPGFATWAQTVGTFDTYDVATDPADFKHVLLSFHSGWHNSDAGVAESKDGGVTWITHNPAGAWHAGMSIAFLKDSKSWLLGTQDIGYWRTGDSGASWNKVSDTAIQHGGGTIYYTKSGILYASGSSRNMRSTDDGLTWTSIGTNGGYNAIFGDGTNLFTGACFGPAPFLISPESDGATWTAQSSQMFIQGPFEFAVDSANGILYSASWQSGMWALKLPPK